MPALAAVDLGRAAPETAADCDRLSAEHPDDLDAWRCYLYVARAFADWNGSIAALETRLALDAGTPGALLYLGRLRIDRSEPGGLETVLQAADAFAALGNAAGEVEARLAAADTMRRGDDPEAAEGQIDRADEAAARDGSRRIRAKVLAGRGRLSEKRGDVAAARAQMEEAIATLGDQPDALLRAYIENGLGGVAWYEGRLEDAYRHFRRAAEFHRTTGDRPAEASERYNAALVASRLHYRGTLSAEDLRNRLVEAFDVALASGSPVAEASIRMLRAQDPSLSSRTRLAEAERAVELTRATGEISRYTFGLRLMAILEDNVDPEGGPARRDRLLEESLEISTARAQFTDVARTRAILGDVAKGSGDFEAAADHYERGVDAVERLRDNQPDELAAARFLWDWAFLYYRAVGALLEPNRAQPRADDLDRAFRILERLRARAALQSLDDAGATTRAGRGASRERKQREQILREIAAVQRRLLAPGLSREEADTLSADLTRLETAERASRVELARADPDFARLRYAEIVGIREVQEALGPREALLTFQMSTRETDDRKWYWNGGSWVIVVTRSEARAHPLPDVDILTTRIKAFLGLLERRDGTMAEAGEALYDDLLRRAIEDLPEETDRLLVVTAGGMHQLPLAVLGPAGGPPLASRFAVARIPSASWWVERRSSTSPSARRASLSLADPTLPAAATGGGARGEGRLRDLALAPLPRARGEAREVAARIGSGTVWTGEEASESALRQASLRGYGLLHFAAHAVVDDRSPDASALVLAPGDPNEDGLLQIREIVGLDLPGAIVLLSACRSAGGEITEADGVFGLARGFFEAGARAVIATLVPVRDDEAAAMAREFAGRLAEGTPVAEALAQSQRACVETGSPAIAWGAFVVLGDPDAALEKESPGRAALSVGAVAIVLWGLLFLARRFRPAG